MRSSNPVLTGRGFARINPDVLNRPAQAGEAVNAYESRPASAPVTMDDVVIKTTGLFAVLVVVGGFARDAVAVSDHKGAGHLGQV